VYQGADHAEIVSARLEGRTTITGSFSEFWLRDLYDADGDAL